MVTYTNAVREGSTCWITVNFYDKDSVLENPQSANYTIHDVKSGQTIVAETALSPSGGTVEITVKASENAMVDPDRDYEVRRLTVKATFGADDAHNQTFDFTVINLSTVSS